jgi:hypothetical protein
MIVVDQISTVDHILVTRIWHAMVWFGYSKHWRLVEQQQHKRLKKMG